jgi:hypothetical protein
LIGQLALLPAAGRYRRPAPHKGRTAAGTIGAGGIILRRRLLRMRIVEVNCVRSAALSRATAASCSCSSLDFPAPVPIPLISAKEFPVPLLREFCPNQLVWPDIPVQASLNSLQITKNSPQIPAYQGISPGKLKVGVLKSEDNRRLFYCGVVDVFGRDPCVT